MGEAAGSHEAEVKPRSTRQPPRAATGKARPQRALHISAASGQGRERAVEGPARQEGSVCDGMRTLQGSASARDDVWVIMRPAPIHMGYSCSYM